MKKILLVGLLLIVSSQLMAETPQEILRKARENYYKEQEKVLMEKKAEEKKAKMMAEEEAKKEKLAREQEAKAMKLQKEDQAKQEKLAKEQEEKKEKLKKEEETKQQKVKKEKEVPKTNLEKLEELSSKAETRVDFYERVVRSVAREETELKQKNEEWNKKSKYNKIPKVTGLGK